MFTRLVGTCTDTEGKPNALLLSPEGTQFLRDGPQIRTTHLKLLRAEDLFEQKHLLISCQIFYVLIDALQFQQSQPRVYPLLLRERVETVHPKHQQRRRWCGLKFIDKSISVILLGRKCFNWRRTRNMKI